MPPSPKRDPKIDIPAGFGALAITVKPPPVIAPAITAYLSEEDKSGTTVAKCVMAALSLNAVKIVAPIIIGNSVRLPSTGLIHHSWQPP